MKKERQLIGLMSGTSLDGLDIAHVKFSLNRDKYSFDLLHCKTSSFPKNLLEKLTSGIHLNPVELLSLDKELGKFMAEEIRLFFSEFEIDERMIDAIASHGHTIHHQPKLGFTQQIGCGETLAFHTGISVINDFRTKDVVAGGQGAPLVPIGDHFLFGDCADAFLNIGGFCNISFHQNGKTKAFDICPGNLPLNRLAQKFGKIYDKGGEIAKRGKVNDSLLSQMNNLEFYQITAPKSLGVEWLNEVFYQLNHHEISAEDLMRTSVEHIAFQISKVLKSNNLKSVFITGGGAKNHFLIQRIEELFGGRVIIPDSNIIDFKEALIFAFLGLRFLEGKFNCLADVTGATKNVVGGVLHVNP